MALGSNVAPVIKKKKIVAGAGHHGGAWKVAYADFVTAMMAFFMLMWLLNATTEKQRKGLADYFSPTVALSRESSGSDGMFQGNSIFAEDVLPRNGTGASAFQSTPGDKARGSIPQPKRTDAEADQAFKKVESVLLGLGGESMLDDQQLKHVVSRVTDEGLEFEFFEIPGAPLFDTKDRPLPTLVMLANALALASDTVENDISIEGHVSSAPIVRKTDPAWTSSTNRAFAFRDLMLRYRFDKKRVRNVSAYGDREPAARNPMSVRNNRIKVVLLRDPPPRRLDFIR